MIKNLFIYGSSGSGKSYLVYELLKKIEEVNGIERVGCPDFNGYYYVIRMDRSKSLRKKVGDFKHRYVAYYEYFDVIYNERKDIQKEMENVLKRVTYNVPIRMIIVSLKDKKGYPEPFQTFLKENEFEEIEMEVENKEIGYIKEIVKKRLSDIFVKKMINREELKIINAKMQGLIAINK